MFDIGGWEFLIVIVIAIIVIGPKDLPGAIRSVTGWIRRARELAREFQSGIDDLAREADMDNVKNDIQSGLGLDEFKDTGNSIRGQIENTIDPDRDIEKAFKDEPVKDDLAEADDGPFADNSFEEDEDIDGAEVDKEALSEDQTSIPETAALDVLEKDASESETPALDPPAKKTEV